MEEVPQPEREEPDTQEDLLVKRLRVFLFDENMRPRKGRKEFLIALVNDLDISKEDAKGTVSDEVYKILELLYDINPHYSPTHKKRKDGTVEVIKNEGNRRLDYLLTLIRRVNIGMGSVPKGPFHQHLFPRLSMPALETYAKASAQARQEVDKYYQSILAQHQLTDIQTRILTAIRHKDLKKLKLALNNPNFTITNLKAIGIFDPLLYAHLNDFQEGLNAIYSACKNKYGADSANPKPIKLLALSIHTHQNKNRWPNSINYYDFGNNVRLYNVNTTRLLEIACEAHNREMVNFLCAAYGFMETAIQSGNLEEVKRLVENGVNPTDYPIEHWYANGPSSKPYSYVHFAITKKQTEIAKYLIDKSSLKDICEDENIFAKAAEANSLEILQYLFKKIGKKKAYFGSATNLTGLSPLQHACCNGNVAMTTVLVKSLPKTAINEGAMDSSIARRHGTEHAYTGRAALYFACNQKDPKTAKTLAKMLLEYGAEVDSASIWGETPLLAAYSNNNVGLALTLIENGANPLRSLGPLKYKFSLTGVPEDRIDHVSRINQISEEARKDLVIHMLNRYITDHPTREMAQRLLNSIEGREPSLTAGDKFRLFFAPTLGKIYKIAVPFLKISEQDLQSFAELKETDPLLVSDDEIASMKSASQNSPRKIAQGTTGASPSNINNSNHDNPAATSPRSRSSSSTAFGLEGKEKDKVDRRAPLSKEASPKKKKK